MGENLCQLYIWQGINNQNKQGTQKAKLLKYQWPNKEMGKWTEQITLSKEEVQIAKKHEEMLKVSVYKGNANQNQFKILPHSC
jgi:hypothetical protein